MKTEFAKLEEANNKIRSEQESTRSLQQPNSNRLPNVIVLSSGSSKAEEEPEADQEAVL